MERKSINSFRIKLKFIIINYGNTLNLWQSCLCAYLLLYMENMGDKLKYCPYLTYYIIIIFYINIINNLYKNKKNDLKNHI